MDVNPGLSTTVTVKYNVANRKAVFNPLSFNDSGITSANASSTGIPNTINIADHGLVTGHKIIHTFTGSESSLTNNKEYYVYVIDSNKISLVENGYEVTKPKPDFIKVNITTGGWLSPINPSVKILEGQLSTLIYQILLYHTLKYITSYPAFYLSYIKIIHLQKSIIQMAQVTFLK